MNTSNPDWVFHIAEPQAWAARTSIYKPQDFASESFIHLSTKRQVLTTAQRYYAGRDDLLLLSIRAALLSESLVYENLIGGKELFPHYYAALPCSAVGLVSPLVLLADGTFHCDGVAD